MWFCSIRARFAKKRKTKYFRILGRLRELKKTKPHLLIGVGGCVASQEGQQIVSRAPYVDVVFGPQTLHRLSDLIALNGVRLVSSGRYLFSGDRKV
jgi:tRNA-2-methylthio-N6-dimethylallyladenosine synthase